MAAASDGAIVAPVDHAACSRFMPVAPRRSSVRHKSTMNTLPITSTAPAARLSPPTSSVSDASDALYGRPAQQQQRAVRHVFHQHARKERAGAVATPPHDESGSQSAGARKPDTHGKSWERRAVHARHQPKAHKGDAQAERAAVPPKQQPVLVRSSVSETGEAHRADGWRWRRRSVGHPRSGRRKFRHPGHRRWHVMNFLKRCARANPRVRRARPARSRPTLLRRARRPTTARARRERTLGFLSSADRTAPTRSSWHHSMQARLTQPMRHRRSRPASST
eukprot:scaffold10117_cov111-Isochrysis_galbana.AAC.9